MKRKVLRSVDKGKSLEKCFEKAPLIVEVVKRGGSWWDAALHLGIYSPLQGSSSPYLWNAKCDKNRRPRKG